MAYHTMPFAVWPERTVDRSSVLTESWRRHSEARPLGQGGEFPRLASIQLSMNTEEIYPLTYIVGNFFSIWANFFATFYKKFILSSIGRQRNIRFYALISLCLQIICKFNLPPHIRFLELFLNFTKKFFEKVQEIFIPSLIYFLTFSEFEPKIFVNF